MRTRYNYLHIFTGRYSEIITARIIQKNVYFGGSFGNTYFPVNTKNKLNHISTREFIYSFVPMDIIHNPDLVDTITPTRFISNLTSANDSAFRFKGSDIIYYFFRSGVYVYDSGKPKILILFTKPRWRYAIETGNEAIERIFIDGDVFRNHPKLKNAINNYILAFIYRGAYDVHVTTNILDKFYNFKNAIPKFLDFKDFNEIDKLSLEYKEKVYETLTSIKSINITEKHHVHYDDNTNLYMVYKGEQLVGLLDTKQEVLEIFGNDVIFASEENKNEEIIEEATEQTQVLFNENEYDFDFVLTSEEESFIDKTLHQLKTNNNEERPVYEGEQKLKEMAKELQISEEFFNEEEEDLPF